MHRPLSKRTAAVAALAVLTLSVVFAGVASAQPVSSKPNVNTFGGGGQYRGPSDTIPPNLVPPDCTTYDPSSCDPSLIPSDAPAPQCGFLDGRWSPAGDQCVRCDENDDCFEATGFDLSFGDVKAYCGDQSQCPGDAAGNITTCVSLENVCEVHLFQSDWINHLGFDWKQACAPIATQVWINGQPHFPVARPFDEEHVEGFTCDAVEVCFTFNRDCLCEVADQWQQVVWPPSNYDGTSWFHAGFTTCEACEGCS